jgi:RNA polymerase primary sigma factor
MLDQNTFMETIREVAEIIRTSAEPLSKEEILGYFGKMELNEAQQNMVLEYLLKPQDEVTEEETENNTHDVKNTEVSEDGLPASPVFQMYLEEIQELEVYSGEELEDLYEELLEGEVDRVRKISDSWMMRVVDSAKELSVTPEDFSDVIQEGNMGLFMKLSELCGSQESVDVDQALEASIFMAMKAYVQELNDEDQVENSIVGKATLVNEARKYLMEENSQEPTVEELVHYTHMDEKELGEILEFILKADKK